MQAAAPAVAAAGYSVLPWTNLNFAVGFLSQHRASSVTSRLPLRMLCGLKYRYHVMCRDETPHAAGRVHVANAANPCQSVSSLCHSRRGCLFSFVMPHTERRLVGRGIPLVSSTLLLIFMGQVLNRGRAPPGRQPRDLGPNSGLCSVDRRPADQEPTTTQARSTE